MSKLTKSEIGAHNQACEILKQDTLSFDDKLFVLENWHEGATNINSSAGAFFTPTGLARDFSIEVHGRRIIDLCAGIGSLSFATQTYSAIRNKPDRDSTPELTCVEINPVYVEVGKKILPEATWICGSIFDVEFDTKFDCAISNPPFGNIKTGRDNDGLGGFEFSAIKRASELAKRGVFILPQMSTPFKYSGNRRYEETMPAKVKRFIEKTNIEYEFNCGIDTSGCLKDWRGVSPMCEICHFDFDRETW